MNLKIFFCIALAALAPSFAAAVPVTMDIELYGGGPGHFRVTYDESTAASNLTGFSALFADSWLDASLTLLGQTFVFDPTADNRITMFVYPSGTSGPAAVRFFGGLLNGGGEKFNFSLNIEDYNYFPSLDLAFLKSDLFNNESNGELSGSTLFRLLNAEGQPTFSVPEPQAWPLVAFGVTVMCGILRRRRTYQ